MSPAPLSASTTGGRIRLASGQAVQAARCAPLAAAFEGSPAAGSGWRDTVAEGIAIAQPPRADEVVAAVAASGGRFLTAEEAGILPAQRALARHELVAEQLQSALNSRIVIEQAKGFLAERLAVSVDAAFGLLRGYARDHNRKLTGVASDIVEGRLQVRPPGRP